ncbi:GNAT family N-acetyltransferase [Candidatus Woesearchaeota archaeon]|nr:GNAT family N-acetyltransferase [Candidatus Woesearchaeota archaeon]
MITIRKAILKDVPNILKLWMEFMKEHDGIIFKQTPKLMPLLTRKKDAAEIFRKFVQKNIRSKNGILHIAEINGNPVGYSLAFIKDNVRVYKTEKVGYISDLFIKKENRTKGISSRFKDEAIKWLRKKGIKHISIAVHKENKLAYSIYQKWGFLDYHIELRRKI